MKGWSCTFVILLFAAIAFAQDFDGYIDINYTFQPEGIEYINFNGEVGFLLSSLNNDGTIYKCVDSGLCTVFSTGSGKLTGTVGLQMDVPNRLLYACNINNFANLTASASVAAINLDDGTLQWNADVTKLGTAGVPKFVNDVSPPDSKGNIYATESFQGLVFKVNSAGKASLFASGDLLAPQDELGFGANGIELLSYQGNEFLLVGVSGLSKETSPLVKIPLSNPSKMAAVEINSDGVFGFDGLFYDEVAEILYIVNNQENKVQKLASSDGFTTASLIDEQGVNCPGAPPSTVVHLNDPNLAGSAFVVCPNGFSRAGPYQIENVQFFLASTEYYYANYYTSASSSLVFAFTLFFAIVFFAI